MSHIIRNPKRNSQPQQTRYVPEHVRLNKVPIVMGYDDIIAPNSHSAKIPVHNGSSDSVWMGFNGDSDESDFISDSDSDAVSQHDTVNVGDFILMIAGDVIVSGGHETIINRINKIVYGDDPKFSNKNLEPEDFIVLQRHPVSFGAKIG